MRMRAALPPDYDLECPTNINCCHLLRGQSTVNPSAALADAIAYGHYALSLELLTQNIRSLLFLPFHKWQCRQIIVNC